MKTPASSLRKLLGSVSALVLASASAAFGGDLVLQKVPATAPVQRDSVNIAFVNYSVTGAQAKPRALYVSSGIDLKRAEFMVDGQLATSYAFASGDALPTAVIDLGKPQLVNRLTANFAPRKGSMAFYVLNALPESTADEAAADLPNNLKLSSETLSALKPVGSVENDGSRSEAAVEFTATAGRYVMIRWNPAIKQDRAFTIAQVAAFGPNSDDNTATAKAKHRYNDVTDSKDIADSKTVADTKDVPAEGPEAPPPAEGPPPGLPPPPPFTFIPQIVPVSP